MWELSPPSTPITFLAAASFTAVVLHQSLFRRVEVDNYPLVLCILVGLAYFILAASLRYGNTEYSGALSAHTLAFSTVSCFVLSLWTNILIYRAFFHPLRKFPGPFGAKLSKFWSLNKAMRSGLRYYQVVDQLHEKYGDFVRTGPREIMIFDAAAINPVLGYGSKTTRGPFYDSWEQTVHNTRDRDFHRRRRKIWDTAFKQSLSDYGPRIEGFTDLLLSRLGDNSGKSIDVNELCIYYAYDVMSALAFGNAMGFVGGDSNADANRILANIQEGIDGIGMFTHIPWGMKLLTNFSFLIGPMRELNKWSEKQVAIRKMMKSAKPDLFSYLDEATPKDSAGQTLLFADTRLIIGAGSDTTATTLTQVFIYLALYPEWRHMLQKEVDEVFSGSNYSCSRTQPILEAIINEVLRLRPTVLTGSQRLTPPEGLTIGDTYIPGETIVWLPPYQLNRDERNFVDAKQFRPERWLSSPELVINRNAFMPFLMGPYICAGRTLAMMEIRSVISRTVHEFDIGFPPGTKFDEEEYFSKVKEHFIASAPKQQLVFTKRA